MANILKLEEMLEQTEAFRKETLIMSSKRATQKIAEFAKKNGWGFVPDEYFFGFAGNIRRCITRGVFEPCVWEMIYNAVRSGNEYPANSIPLPHHDSHVILRLHQGKKGIIAEIEDQGKGIPERIIEILNKENYHEDFIYRKGKDERGRGFHSLKLALEDKNVDAVGFNEKRNAIYLMALYK
ncbi:MAG: ATP-binding protein [Candidatus Nanoarchaeia archaeon]|jgi:signal transduction histidine kinase